MYLFIVILACTPAQTSHQQQQPISPTPSTASASAVVAARQLGMDPIDDTNDDCMLDIVEHQHAVICIVFMNGFLILFLILPYPNPYPNPNANPKVVWCNMCLIHSKITLA